ncbi:hypothetical protein [Paenibacillus paridis]|nr:hypothetical protein [Paenibacillus paridis]
MAESLSEADRTVLLEMEGSWSEEELSWSDKIDESLEMVVN